MLSSFLLSTHFSLSSSSLYSLHVEDFKINALFPLNYPFKRQPHKMVKHTRWQQLTSVFDHFLGLALRGLYIPHVI